MFISDLQFIKITQHTNMKIDFENPKTTSVRKLFDGELETGEKFTIDAEWTDWDGWEVIEIMWDDNVVEDKEEEIKEYFLNDNL